MGLQKKVWFNKIVSEEKLIDGLRASKEWQRN